MSNFITKVQEAETEAKKILEAAKNQALQIIKTSEVESKKKNENLYTKALEEAKAKLEDAKNQAKKVYNEAVSSYQQQYQSLNKKMTDKEQKIIDQCISTIIDNL